MSSHISFVSFEPLVLRIQGLASVSRKRQRGPTTTYTEGNISDPDDYLSTDEDEVLPATQLQQQLPTIPSPPPGTLSTLWYSREAFLDVWVVDKVLGWKRRTKMELPGVTIPPEEAVQWQQKLLNDLHKDSKPEISRIQPALCPLVMAAFAHFHKLTAQFRAATSTPDSSTGTTTNATDVLVPQAPLNEEVFLIKWRGRSHIHCSWERLDDLLPYRNKIKRFEQTQTIEHGQNWKEILEEERNLLHHHHHHHTEGQDVDEDEPHELELYFSPPGCREVDRILACDESHVDPLVLAKQRALNQKDERQAWKIREGRSDLNSNVAPNANSAATHLYTSTDHKVEALLRLMESIAKNGPNIENEWDPEDNVRYVVKWKGLPTSEITWEYWRDIKSEAVTEVEDFWYRQQLPSIDIEKALQVTDKPHPHVREFRKLQESPLYGISTKERPSVDLEEDQAMSVDEDEDSFSGFQLRGYQLEGVNWLLFNWFNKRSCILADEMGLGKTIQSAAFLQELQRLPATQIRGPFLIVAPLSLVTQWQSELASWAPDMNVILYHGSADARSYLVQQEFWYSDQFLPKSDAVKLKKAHITKFHVMITTYEVALKDMSVLSKVRWKALIVDEAHRLKNSKSRLFDEFKSLPRDYCILLTGTPIANATEELWALLHFANPVQFRDKDDFLEKFGQMTDSKQVNELHNLLKPYLLRRVKEDVEKSLPPKEETILEVSLTPIQKAFYKAIYERNTQFLFKGAKRSNAPSLMNVMMELRKCCNHPYLVKGAEERIIDDAALKLKEQVGNSIDYHKLFADQLIKSSGKMVLLEKLLHKLFDGGHKILIFSQMVRVLDLLEELLRIKRFKYERLDGSTSSTSRLAAVDRFRRKSAQRFVMLLSTRAGGLGLNLTAADTVIIYDSDWNPQNDLQAMARAHRIGQTRAVRVYRLLTAKTYEMHMFHSASLKLGLERAVLSQNRDQADESDDDKKKKSVREMQAKEIDELLKKGAYDVFRDDDDAEAEKFMETDIDQLLKHSAKTVTYGNSATQSIGSGLGSFSKASFVTNTEDGEKDVDLDDPDFWSKAVGLEVPVDTPEEIAAMLDDGVKRQRKQVQVYDPYADTAEAEQKRKERIALEKQLEKEEKERQKEEKLRKKKEVQDKKKRERIDRLEAESAAKNVTKDTYTEKKDLVLRPDPPRPKKSKKNDRQRALRRAENEDPMLERLKQGWEVQQKNKASAAALRFGFGRFCKLRSASNLTSLPIQDVEVFVRSYSYQLALQAGIGLMKFLNKEVISDNLRGLIKSFIGSSDCHEVDFLCDALLQGMKCQFEVESSNLFLRMPVILVEASYVQELQRGSALRCLRRLCVLDRFTRFFEACIDKVLASLGPHEQGKRGCVASELQSMDADLKARFVTSEELALMISAFVTPLQHREPVTWWDHECDIYLLVGTFVHGLGNYQSLRNDSSLPFIERLRIAKQNDEGYKRANDSFRVIAEAAKAAFDDALEAGRVKAELEIQAAVAAAARAAAKREEDAATLRKGGAEAENVISEMPNTQVADAFAYDGTDSHFVTLSRLQKYIHDALRDEAVDSTALPMEKSDEANEDDARDDEDNDIDSSGRRQDPLSMPMPDSRVLDYRFTQLLLSAERNMFGNEEESDMNPLEKVWEESDAVKTSIGFRDIAFRRFMGTHALDYIQEYSGIGIGSTQCSNPHKSLNDGSDYAFGAASPHMFNISHGTDAPRYLRALGVPMNLTRFALSGLAYATPSCCEELLRLDRLRFYGDESKVQAPTTASGAPVAEPSDSNPQHMAIPVDPISMIPDEFQVNSTLRAVACVTALFYGIPSTNWKDYPAPSTPFNAFSMREFCSTMSSFEPELPMPDENVVFSYLHGFLLPHCLRLCLNGNGPTTRSARGSQGEYETALGISVQAQPTQAFPCPLPDPCLSPQQHSAEAVGYANAILRRTRLLVACQNIVLRNGEEYSRILDSLARSRVMSQNLEANLPHWWCPWKHDVGLVEVAARRGVLAICIHRDDEELFRPSTLKSDLLLAFEQRMQNPNLSENSRNKMNEWADAESHVFPTMFQLEQRLGLFCSLITAGEESSVRYDHLPMYDHGGWPRK